MSNSQCFNRPLEEELLIPAEKRRISINDHKAFRESLAMPIDHDLAADPILDHLPQLRSRKKIGRLLGILDQLNNSNKEEQR